MKEAPHGPLEQLCALHGSRREGLRHQIQLPGSLRGPYHRVRTHHQATPIHIAVPAEHLLAGLEVEVAGTQEAQHVMVGAKFVAVGETAPHRSQCCLMLRRQMAQVSRFSVPGGHWQRGYISHPLSIRAKHLILEGQHACIELRLGHMEGRWLLLVTAHLLGGDGGGGGAVAAQAAEVERPHQGASLLAAHLRRCLGVIALGIVGLPQGGGGASVGGVG
mmetsp:Transcript_14037/g.42363  ORF Transcript_14037/g.42363 Transcript_14037/m.42363 type:complete len:219 (-) Transcript_14037:889-1545(-)